MNPKGAALIIANLIGSPTESRLSQRLLDGVIKVPPGSIIVDLVSSDSDKEITYTTISENPSPDDPSTFVLPVVVLEKIEFTNIPDQENDRFSSDQLESPSPENTPQRPITLDGLDLHSLCQIQKKL
ncbi:hypothetical protein PanWU01x14_298250 [Parasponia andersonii]|uniref:Uncharacterized protein n=1 Tax=Parasponia andersonii TaxID=3476 RepID=A0A2P5AV08_PARAD|nr:hypothetical protein PanWU01x14_298250 [Parasponia andersonii]